MNNDLYNTSVSRLGRRILSFLVLHPGFYFILFYFRGAIYRCCRRSHLLTCKVMKSSSAAIFLPCLKGGALDIYNHFVINGKGRGALPLLSEQNICKLQWMQRVAMSQGTETPQYVTSSAQSDLAGTKISLNLGCCVAAFC